MKSKTFSLFCCLFITCVSCQSIHYTNNSKVPKKDYSYSQWHHIGLFGFLEISSPVHLKAICQRKNWQAVRTQTGFIQTLIQTIPGVLLQAIGLPGGVVINTIYTPEEVSIICKK